MRPTDGTTGGVAMSDADGAGLWETPLPELSAFESADPHEALAREHGGPDVLLALLAKSTVEARKTYTMWAFSETHGEASELFARAADRQQKHAELCRYHLPSDPPSGPSNAMFQFVRDRDSTTERLAAGVVARSLVTGRSCRGIRDVYATADREAVTEVLTEIEQDLDEFGARGVDLLERICETRADLRTARETAAETIRIAHEGLERIDEGGP